MTLSTQPAKIIGANNLAPQFLQVSTLPLPGDVRVRIHFQPTAALGALDVQVGLGQGTRGKGQRVGDDPAVQAALLYRLAAHLAQYAREYAAAAADEEPGWWERLAAASAALDPAPLVPDTAGHGWAIEMGALQAECEPF